MTPAASRPRGIIEAAKVPPPPRSSLRQAQPRAASLNQQLQRKGGGGGKSNDGGRALQRPRFSRRALTLLTGQLATLIASGNRCGTKRSRTSGRPAEQACRYNLAVEPYGAPLCSRGAALRMGAWRVSSGCSATSTRIASRRGNLGASLAKVMEHLFRFVENPRQENRQTVAACFALSRHPCRCFGLAVIVSAVGPPLSCLTLFCALFTSRGSGGKAWPVPDPVFGLISVS